MKRETKKQLITFIILFVFLGSSFTYAILYALPSGTQYVHWHAMLYIKVDGEDVPIPVNIGVDANGDAAPNVIHIHAGEPNKLHKEGPSDLNLTSFFEAWGEPFNSTCIMSYCNNSTYQVTMYVNGQPNLDFENYVFKDGDVIEIDYGPI